MRIHWAWLLPVALIAGTTGKMTGHWHEKMKRMQQGSMAGQTLADLARALENEKYNKGSYPETIAGLKVQSEFGDFSEVVLSRTKYYRTEGGYIAFVGSPGVQWIQAGTSPRLDH